MQHQTDWQQLTFNSTWAGTLEVRKINDMVEVRADFGAGGGTNPVATVPSGMEPSKHQLLHAAFTSGYSGRFDIRDNGDIYVYAPGAASTSFVRTNLRYSLS